ncbi:olxA [Serratia silvae]|uniref:OlxA n=1 Tax=Serratia silvae TaxID=2824122 RepID=A0ABT0KHY4_9GAMM|nr:olxA [Serratia silvae]MCL1031354.1 olxA [Serratia silvae]
MTTLIDTVQPSEDYIEKILYLHALEGRSEEEFVTVYLTGLASRLKANPALYRVFGPWWPTIKTMFIHEFGPEVFANEVAQDVRAIYSLSRPALSMVAAHLYSEERIERGLFYAPQHELAVHAEADDTEPYIYYCDDDQMEKLIAWKGAVA